MTSDIKYITDGDEKQVFSFTPISVVLMIGTLNLLFVKDVS